jgi:MFS family permease
MNRLSLVNRFSLPSKNLTLLWFCQCVTTLGLMSMVPIMPLYLAQLGAGYSAVWGSAALAAPAVTALALSSRIGKACDRYGYRVLVLASLLGFALSMALMALSSDISGFLIGRLLLGASGVGVTLTSFACAASRPENRGRVLGLLQSASACGCLIGPVAGGILLDLWSLRPLLIATAVFCGLAALFASWGLREPASTEPEDTRAIPQSLRESLIKSRRPLGFGLALRGLQAFPGSRLSFLNRPPACVQKNASISEMPVSQRPSGLDQRFPGWLSTLRDPTTRNWMLAACLAQAAAFALVNTFVLFLEPRLPATSLASVTGMVHAAAWAATMLASPWWGRANDAGDARRNFYIAALGCALSIGLLSLASQLWQILLLRILQGGCFAALTQSVFFSLSRVQSSLHQGEGIGLAKSYLVLGQILGPALVAVLLPWCEPSAILWGVSLLFVTAALFAFRVPKNQKLQVRTRGSGLLKI